ncbi:hypothetical protein [Nocardia shimofusensis]|uniref:hypothetical protein n=1 Tax=Nocardia shimofusensis TaxID=228596 RepID=UPI000835731B|nr:hypothetical protein [Nocardia shimofusensis]
MTDDFKVAPEALEELSGKLTGLADDNSTTESYIDTWLDVKGDVGGIFPNIVSTIQQRTMFTLAPVGRIASGLSRRTSPMTMTSTSRNVGSVAI